MNRPSDCQAKIDAFNGMTEDSARQTMRALCGSETWVERMCAGRPFESDHQLREQVESTFDELADEDWLAAFAHHPKIGDLDSLKAKYAGNREWSGGEQAGVNAADEATLIALAKGNKEYESRFGYIFIVCASGKSAAEMLRLLKERLDNESSAELKLAAEEQRKITRLRLEKWLDEHGKPESWSENARKP